MSSGSGNGPESSMRKRIPAAANERKVNTGRWRMGSEIGDGMGIYIEKQKASRREGAKRVIPARGRCCLLVSSQPSARDSHVYSFSKPNSHHD